MRNIVVYTCITGNYDKLTQPVVQNSGNIDFICFSDKPVQDLGVWKIRSIPEDLIGLDQIRQQRIVKICPHRYLKDYDISLWIDGNVRLIGQVSDFVKRYDLSKTSFYTRLHPTRDCIYQEGAAVIEAGKDTPENVNSVLSRYRSERYPQHIGLAETNVILRQHNDPACIRLCNAWATEVLLRSYRDQLSFNYVCWKQGFLPGYLTSELNIKNNSFFDIKRHG